MTELRFVHVGYHGCLTMTEPNSLQIREDSKSRLDADL